MRENERPAIKLTLSTQNAATRPGEPIGNLEGRDQRHHLADEHDDGLVVAEDVSEYLPDSSVSGQIK